MVTVIRFQQASVYALFFVVELSIRPHLILHWRQTTVLPANVWL